MGAWCSTEREQGIDSSCGGVIKYSGRLGAFA